MLSYWHQCCLAGISAVLLASDEASAAKCCVRQIPDEYHLRYLGHPGATETEIVSAETRFGTVFPPSYRAFLQASNGWGPMGINFPGRFWNTEEIEWL